MREPEAPFLELHFYLTDNTDPWNLYRVVRELVNLRANLVGSIAVHEGSGVRDSPFRSPLFEDMHDLEMRDLSRFDELLRDENLRPVRVLMTSASGTTEDVAELITFDRISEEAAIQDRHPIAIYTSGDAFNLDDAEESQRIGLRAYRRFRELVERLKPTYAAITVEEALECLTDLRLKGPSFMAFRNFYVSGREFGGQMLSELRSIFDGAFIEEMADGLYISCWPDFNPEHRMPPFPNSESSFLADRAASLIASSNRE
jgi:hypothetical protein